MRSKRCAMQNQGITLSPSLYFLNASIVACSLAPKVASWKVLSTTHFLSSFPPSDVVQLFPETVALCRASQKMIFFHYIFLKENAVGTSEVGKQPLVRRRSPRQRNGTRGHKYNASEIQQHRRGNTCVILTASCIYSRLPITLDYE